MDSGQPRAGRPAEPHPRGGVDLRFTAGLVAVLVLVAGSGLVVLWPRTTPPRVPAGPGPTAAGAPRPSAAAAAAILDEARRLAEQDDLAGARAALERGIAEHPEDQEVRIALGETLLRTQDLAGAYDQYVAALAIGPRDAQLEFLAGTLASRLQKFDRAVEHYSAAQAADPSRPEYPLFLAQVQARLNDDAGAKASLLRVIALDEGNATAWGSLADLMLRQNALTLARQHIDRARQLEPRTPAWKIIEARLLKREGEPEKALLLLDSLGEPEKGLKPVLGLRAECFGLLSRPADAAAMYRAASDAAPQEADLAYLAADWLHRAGAPDAADYARRAAMLGHPDAQALLARIGG